MRIGLPRIKVRWSIKGRILLAFTAMSGITVILGAFAVSGADRSASLVRNTYDETVIATSYARAAAGDFANMRAGFAHEMMSPASRKDIARQMSAALDASFQSDLATAIEKSSADTTGLGADLRRAEAEWVAASEQLGPKPTGAAWDALEARSQRVEDLLEVLVTRVSDRGYAYRQEAQATMGRDITLTTGGVTAAIAIAGFVALMLYLRISAPIGAAARFANEIASGTLTGKPPDHTADEIGDLIHAMVSMRTDIGTMMSEQVILREQSQARVAEALDGSREGVVIVDAKGTIQIANRRALDFLDVRDEDVAAGLTVEALLARMRRSGHDRSALLLIRGEGPETEETLLPDGRWIQNSRNRTTEGGLVALYTDITAIRDQTDRLAEANSTLDAALGNMSQGLCVFDANNCLKLANARSRAMFGLDEARFPSGTPYVDLVVWAVGTMVDGEAVSVDRLLRHEMALIRRRRSISRSFSVGERIFAVTQEPMPDGGWIATYEDVTEKRRAEGQIAFLANHDALTHLPNRTMFARRVDEALIRARRGVGFAVLCLDLDHFKQVNDTLGHAIGDLLLQAAAERLLSCVRETDTVARLGGDEFAILQADVITPSQAVPLAQRIVNAVAMPYMLEGHELNVGVSVGIALSPSDGLSHGQLLKCADSALYKSKEEGRGTWRFFEAAMDETLQLRRALEADLRHAIANNEFEIHYQPLLDVRSGVVGGFEALVRWRHPTRGLVPPDQFIPLAEETGLIKDIGFWVLGAACQEATQWPARMRIAVNVSAIQLRDKDFVEMVRSVLRQTGLPADQLELEITETVFMANNAKVLPILTALRAGGIRFAMDDFGTGYSSLSTLRAFPFDKIKIDRSFVRDLVVDEAAGQIARTILALGHSLNMRVTAEGVETVAQRQFLEALGCDEIQGYLIGRPAPAADIQPLLSARSARSEATLAA
jgi:diguanylate cyclase (GGDEF)-like protein